MGCPSTHPIDTGSDCEEKVCDQYCFGGPCPATYTTKTLYYDRCKNSSGQTVCNYYKTEYNSSCGCYVYGPSCG